MSHNLNVVNGRVSMMYTGEKPWHQLGTKVDNALTSEEAIKVAGLNYEVEKQPIFLANGTKVENQYATVRKDTSVPLGVVGRRYTVLQNDHAFKFADALVGIKEAVYQTAGALGNGEIIWILAKLNGVVEVVKGDITEKYLLLTNRHDGLGSVQIMWTGIRVVCQNTLNMALGSRNDLSVSLRHTASIGMKVDEVRRALGIISAKDLIFAEAAKRLAAVQLTQMAWVDYLNRLDLTPKENDTERAKNMAADIMQDLTVLFERGKGTDIPGVKGTLWAGFNAIVEYIDYAWKSRSSDRAKAVLFGTGAALKQRAWETAIELAK
jgi:phage/plasmid-like protein (TIGR03299 family)